VLPRQLVPAGHIGNALTADTNFPDDLQLVVIAPAPAPLDVRISCRFKS
jgi:hypothetical protein